MDVAAVVDGLNRALALQRRSVLLFSLASGVTTGVLAAGAATRLASYATAELADLGRLTAKLAALEGEPETEVAAFAWQPDPEALLDEIVEAEREAIAALREIIEPAGDEPEGEALEHLLEHAILRKQDQVDFLNRVRRGL